MKKFSILLCFLLSLTIALAACGSNAEKDDSKADNSSEDLLEKVKSDGKIVVGTEGTYAPFTFHDEKTGDLTGFDVEIAQEVGKRLGVDVEFKETQWDAIFAGLDAKRFDMIANHIYLRCYSQTGFRGIFSNEISVSTFEYFFTRNT